MYCHATTAASSRVEESEGMAGGGGGGEEIEPWEPGEEGAVEKVPGVGGGIDCSVI